MDSQINEAIKLFDKYKLQEAKQILECVIKKDMDNIEAHFWLGKIHTRTQQYGDAINSFNTVLSMQPDNVEAKTNLNMIRSILQLTNNFYFENSYTNEDLYELLPYNEIK